MKHHGDHLLDRLAVAAPGNLQEMRLATVNLSGGVGDQLEPGKLGREILPLLDHIILKGQAQRQPVARDDQAGALHLGVPWHQHIDALILPRRG